MVIYTTKVRWRDLSALCALAAAFALCLLGGQSDPAAVAASAAAQNATLQTEYLESLGWEVSGTPTSEQILLPEEFGPEYDGYLALQAAGGFSLSDYAGETVTRYAYPLANFPTGESGVLADLLVWEGQIVGGELRSPDLEGFMLPLVPPERVEGYLDGGEPSE